MAEHTSLSEAQAVVYDRQLRVWGVEVQRKLTAAKVLVAGLGRLAAEIAKNIVLAGVGNVALLDDRPGSEFLGGNFLVTTATPAGASLAEAAAGTLQAMNPLVHVTCLPGAASRVTDPETVRGFDLVIITAQPLSVMQQADAACRQVGASFMAAAVQGVGSFLFLDLGQHSFRPKAAPESKEQPEEQVVHYASMADALAVPASERLPNTHPLYTTLSACAAFEQQHGRPPAGGDAGALLQWLEEEAQAVGGSVAEGVQPVLESWVSSEEEFAPVCAVVGGVAANNVVKAVSRSGAPVNNLFLYDLSDGRGVVEQRGGAPAAAGAANGKPGAAPVEEAIELD